MANILAIANHKGGVGKTTTALTIGVGLAHAGKRVLVVDSDPQGHVALLAGFPPDRGRRELADVLAGATPARDALLSWEGLAILPAGDRLADVEQALVGDHLGGQFRLADALAPLADVFDDVLIDCPPAANILTIGALTAASSVLIPAATDSMTLYGLNDFLATIVRMRVRLNPHLRLAGVLPTRHQRTTRHARAVLAHLTDDLASRVPVFPPIPETVIIKDAARAHQTALTYAPGSEAAHAYMRVVEALV